MASSGTTDPSVSSKELLEAQSHLWNQMLSFMNSFALKTAIELGIPNAIHDNGGPMTLTDLAAALSIPSCRVPMFQRFMSFLVYNDFFTQTTSGTEDQAIITYSLTTNSLFLIKERGVAITPLIEMVMYDALLDPWKHLSAWFKSETPSSAFELCHGAFFWKATRTMPEFGKVMREGLDSDSATVAKVLIENCADQFVGVKTLVEVAGNQGKIAQAIAEAFPDIKCSVLELPHVIEATVPKSDKIEFIAGDMFEKIPSADMLVLKWVLMTWNDEECVRILKKCKDAIPPKEMGGKAIIIDKVIDSTLPDDINKHARHDETQIYYDMQMMVLMTGKQRTEKEWKKLFDEAGFKEYKVVPALGMRCIIEIYH